MSALDWFAVLSPGGVEQGNSLMSARTQAKVKAPQHAAVAVPVLK